MPKEDVRVIADGIRVWFADGIPVLEVTHRADATKREEYIPDGRPMRRVPRVHYEMFIRELSEVVHWDAENKDYKSLNLDALKPILCETGVEDDEMGQAHEWYAVIDNWFTRTRPTMPRDKFDQEYRCKPTVAGSRLVYNEFSERLHYHDAAKFPFMEDQPLYRGWDPSNAWTGVVWCQVDEDGRLIVHRCLIDDRGDPVQMGAKVNSLTQRWFPRARSIIDYGDVYGDTQLSSYYYQQLRSCGIFVQTNQKYGVTPDDRISHTRTLLSTIKGEYPFLIVLNNRENKILVEGFTMECRYKTDGVTVDKKRRPWIDVINALEYVVCAATRPQGNIGRRKRTPQPHRARMINRHRALQRTEGMRNAKY